MCEMESTGNIMAYVYSNMPVVMNHEACDRTLLYDHLEKFGFFEAKESELNNEVLRIFHWFLKESNQEPKIEEIQAEYMSNIYNDIENVGETFNFSSQEIFDTYDMYYAKYDYSIEDRIKDVLDENGLSMMYFRAPEDSAALIASYFGAQTFFPDILKHLIRRRVN